MVLIVVSAAAGGFALVPGCRERRADGYRVLKLALAALGGAGGILALGYKLVQLGLV
ncbi:hypothetical protein M8C13_06850 [Crossiella sp. SN42]|uniref:hypothetical protein n=1 Tax=Crossiella sp. SN42 TaxID=2944808 RepID=UPI00207D0E31|nr:hypothetical protein [Crossiella sp. SN42]MCO1575475.1 hypothetical protein [Crossiella sp. SN42]